VWRKPVIFGRIAHLDLDHGIAYRRALKTLRSRGHQLYEALPIEKRTLEAPDELADAETGEWILSAMQQLPLSRTVAEYAYGYGHSCEEIAKIMDCPQHRQNAGCSRARQSCAPCCPASRAWSHKP